LFTDAAIWSAPVTPFDADGRLDRAQAERVVNELVGEGADVIMVAGSIGEHACLDDGEWRDLVVASVAPAGGRAGVLTTVAGADTRVVDARIETAMSLRVTALNLQRPE